VSVWLTIPSARPPAEANPVLRKWRDMGYSLALWLEPGTRTPPDCAFAIHREYPGYAVAVNTIIEDLCSSDGWGDDPQWFVIGGDDTLPDPNKRADEIARECSNYFGYKHGYAAKCAVAKGESIADTYQRCYGAFQDAWKQGETFGVMQPTGDRYAGGQIDRICGSAWIGREFAKRAYLGNGPLWPDYTHMFVDEELQEVAKRYGVLWQRPDLTQLHMQYCRESAAIDSPAKEAKPPDHITHDGYTSEHWEKYQKIFNERKAAGFPGSELL